MKKIAVRFIAAGPTACALALAAIAAFGGCISPRVAVEASDAAPIARAATIHVALANADFTEAEAEAEAAEAERGAQPVAPAVAEALRAEAERQLETRGYAIGSAATSDLVIEIAARSEYTARRTWSSDPDASASRIVRKPEAVIALRAIEREGGREIWAGDARARLPESALTLRSSAEAVWQRVLAAALEGVPRRE